MKKEIWKNHCKISLLLLCFVFIANTLSTQITKDKTIEKSYTLNPAGTLELEHARGIANIKKSTNNQVIVKLYFKVKAKSEEDVQSVLKQLILEEKSVSADKLQLQTKINIEKWMESFGKSKIIFEDGTTVKGITNLEMKMDVWVPEGINVKVLNRYHDINIETMKANFHVDLHEGNLYSGDLGNLKLKLMYGKARIGNVQNADFILYESNLKMKNGDQFKIDSKYSKHTIGRIKNPVVLSYESEFSVENISGTFDLNDKYSTWEIKRMEEGTFNLYETKMKIDKVTSLNLDSKYTKLKFGEAQSLNFKLSYEDDLEIRNLTKLVSGNSKYGDFEIEQLSGSIDLSKDYETDIDVMNLSSGFKGLSISGKYSKIAIPIPASMKYQLEVDIKHGDVKFPEENFDNMYFKDKDDQLEVKGKIKGATENSPKIYLKGFEINARLQ